MVSGISRPTSQLHFIERLRNFGMVGSATMVDARVFDLLLDVAQAAEMERTTKCDCPTCQALVRLRDAVCR